MKRDLTILTIVLMATAFIAGCSDQTPVSAPENDNLIPRLGGDGGKIVTEIGEFQFSGNSCPSLMVYGDQEVSSNYNVGLIFPGERSFDIQVGSTILVKGGVLDIPREDCQFNYSILVDEVIVLKERKN